MVVATLTLALTLPPCADCHTRQHEEWITSAHAASAASPLYRAMRQWAHADAGEAVAARCAACHTVPTAAGERSTAVECGACHQVASGAGPDTLLIDPNRPVLAPRTSGDAPHPVAVTPAMAGEAPCLPCHGQLSNPAGVPLCTTGPEAAARTAGAPCIACHRPHAFAGATTAEPHRAATVSLDRRGETLRVTVLARGVGHALPTGPALRQVRLEVEILDRRGQRLFDNRTDPDALFARLLADSAGNVPAPPWRAMAVARDTRLAAGERRTLDYPLPPGAWTAEARLVYHRAPPPLLQRLSLAQEASLAPRVIARARLSLVD
ncbi:MAG: hypothetical protein HRF46_09960 [Acidobacteriota bacterium]|jgi:hypothetical protein